LVVQEWRKSQKNQWNPLFLLMSFQENASGQALRFWTERCMSAKASLKGSNTLWSNNPSTVHETSQSLRDSKRSVIARPCISFPLVPVDSCIVFVELSIIQRT